MLTRISHEKINGISKSLTLTLPVDVLNIITYIAHKVGAPSYNKTPNFKKHQRRGRKMVEKKLTTEDWKSIRNFKQTVLNKNNDGIMLEIDTIRKLLNQITKKTYEEKKDEINKIIDKCKTNFEEEEFNKIGKLIFDIGSTNKYCSWLYARLFKNLSEKYEIFNEISKNNIESFSKIFEDIKILKAEDDYDLFCDNNKENNKRKSLGLFFVNLMLEEVIGLDKIIDIIIYLINMVDERINMENKGEEVQEIISNIIILVQNGFREVSKHEKWNDIFSHISKISSSSKKNFKSLSSKSIFSYLDLIEELED
jgi:hypothetical protein